MEHPDLFSKLPDLFSKLPDLFSKLKEKFGKNISDDRTSSAFPFLHINISILENVLIFCRDDAAFRFDYLENLTVVDSGKEFSILYQVYSTTLKQQLNLKTTIEYAKPQIISSCGIWAAAANYELEAAEMFGLEFLGNSEKRHLLLPSDWNGFPLRKDYVFPVDYHGIEHRRAPLRKEHTRP